MKTNINALASTTLEELLALQPGTYNWRTESATTSPHTGFTAQQVQPIFPDIVSQGPDGYLTLNYAGLTPYLVKAIQQLLAKLTDLASTVASFADHFTTKKLVGTDELCVGTAPNETCVNQQQLAALLSAAGTATTPQSVTSNGTGDSTNSETGDNARCLRLHLLVDI